MLKSIRWTLQLWHAAILALALIGFGLAAYYGIARAKYAQVDAEVSGAAQALTAKLRIPRAPPPPRPRDAEPWPEPDRPPPRPPEDQGPKEGPPEDRPPEQGGPSGQGGRGSQRELDLPHGLLERFGDGEADSLYFVIWRADGKVLKKSAANVDPPDPGPGSLKSDPNGTAPPQFRWRGDAREAMVSEPLGQRIVVGRSTARERAELRRLAWLLVGVGGGVLAFGLAGGWLLGLRTVNPIRSISDTAQAISGSHLSGRIDVSATASELETLAQVLNAMFDRLQAAFEQQVRFTADASHELRTPVAIIHSHAELALSRERSPEEYRQTIQTCLRASGRMKGLIESLLLLARADGGKLELDCRSFDLAQVVQECIALLRPLAEQKSLSMEAILPPTPLVGAAAGLAQVATNLLTNAIDYNRDGGKISVLVGADEHEATLVVTDTGIGIGPEDQPHIFERFYRVDKARRRTAGGNGLGLAICKTIVEAHGGTISFTSGSEGTTFTVRLPKHPISQSTSE